MTCLYDTILQQQDNNNSVCRVFLDFSKGFDCVNHKFTG